MIIKGRAINSGNASGKALVLDMPFSFIGDFDPDTGKLMLQNHALSGHSVVGRILVFPTGKGGTIAPWIAYEAAKKGNAPAGILCNRAESITCEVAITIDIPLLDSFEIDLTSSIKKDDFITIEGDKVIVDPFR